MDRSGRGRRLRTARGRNPQFQGSARFRIHGTSVAQTVVKERIYLDRADKDILHDEITTIDHALTRPWTVDRTYVREPNPTWLEKSCHEANSHIVIGSDQYFLSADGKLMPVRQGQPPPPDLKYFKVPPR